VEYKQVGEKHEKRKDRRKNLPMLGMAAGMGGDVGGDATKSIG
jgi:hypothetical protein